MGVIPVCNLIVNSYKGDYEVSIIGKKDEKYLKKYIFKNISIDSFLIVDEKLIKLFPFIKNYWSYNNIISIKSCEKSKTLANCESVIKKLIRLGFKKNMTLVALGGGVIQDITSFTSSILFRGVDWIFVPTTLLSQSDSCIGSKNCINYDKTKNLLGTFYPPIKIFSFLSFLDTLSVNEIKSGIGEILHYYFVDNSNLLYEIKDNYDELIQNRNLLEKHITQSLEIKKRMVEIDEFDKGERVVFNYGHTFGHALESISNFSITHGQAVTRGMDIANYISYKESKINYNTYKEYRKILEKNFPEMKLNNNQIEKFIKLLKSDKKSYSGQIRCIIPDDNNMIVHSITDFIIFKKIITQYVNEVW